MLKFFLPKEEDFFKFFHSIALLLVKTAEQFQRLLQELNNREQHAAIIDFHEREADKMADATFIKLHKTFITPFDRYDIHRLVISLDDIIDSINSTTKRIAIYRLNSIPKEIISVAALCLDASKILCEAVGYLNNMKYASKILSLCDAIEVLENQADQLLLSGESQLFEEENDFRLLLKIKEIYECSKVTIKNCQGLAHVIKNIVLEYS